MDAIKDHVKQRYGAIAEKRRVAPAGGGCCGGGAVAEDEISKRLGYSEAELAAVPDGANLGLGCGNPLGLAALKEGQTVLDLGSGAGFDSFLAANRVGKSGRVIGVDMTDSMLARARENAKKGGYTQVEFRKGEIENLPVDDASVDVITSNCVINLSPDKAQVFREAYRVLKPGGKAYISDILLQRELPESLKNSVAAYTACVGGAIVKEEYLGMIKSAGFSKVEIQSERQFKLSDYACDCSDDILDAVKGVPQADLESAANSVLSVKLELTK